MCVCVSKLLSKVSLLDLTCTTDLQWSQLHPRFSVVTKGHGEKSNEELLWTVGWEYKSEETPKNYVKEVAHAVGITIRSFQGSVPHRLRYGAQNVNKLLPVACLPTCCANGTSKASS